MLDCSVHQLVDKCVSAVWCLAGSVQSEKYDEKVTVKQTVKSWPTSNMMKLFIELEGIIFCKFASISDPFHTHIAA